MRVIICLITHHITRTATLALLMIKQSTLFSFQKNAEHHTGFSLHTLKPQTPKNTQTDRITFALNSAKISKCRFRSVARMASITRKRKRLNSAASRPVRKLFCWLCNSKDQADAAWWFSSTARSLYRTACKHNSSLFRTMCKIQPEKNIKQNGCTDPLLFQLVNIVCLITLCITLPVQQVNTTKPV